MLVVVHAAHWCCGRLPAITLCIIEAAVWARAGAAMRRPPTSNPAACLPACLHKAALPCRVAARRPHLQGVPAKHGRQEQAVRLQRMPALGHYALQPGTEARKEGSKQTSGSLERAIQWFNGKLRGTWAKQTGGTSTVCNSQAARRGSKEWEWGAPRVGRRRGVMHPAQARGMHAGHDTPSKQSQQGQQPCRGEQRWKTTCCGKCHRVREQFRWAGSWADEARRDGGVPPPVGLLQVLDAAGLFKGEPRCL